MKLKEIRQSKHLTQQELSVQSGINLSTIQKLERGENNLSGAKSSTVIALYRVLGSDVFIAAGMTEEEINMYSYNCMNCAHPACQFRGKSNNYCGNYMLKGDRQIEKIKILISSNSNADCVNSTDIDDSASDN